MINVYTLADERLHRDDMAALSTSAVWVDLLEPTAEEEEAVERILGIGVPTREEMQEIEASSRVYRDGDTLYLTTPVVTHADSDDPQSSAVTFILAKESTVTVRYATPQSFITYASRATRQRGVAASADGVLLGLLETITDRLADVLERVGSDLDALSRKIFRPSNGATDLQALLRAIGCHGDLTSKARDSLLGIGRVVSFLGADDARLPRKDTRQRLKTLTRDVRSLNEHAAFLSTKIGFLQDATLGMINIQQNNIIKIFSVVAVVFLPPTLIASIYGMNFQHMPELGWPFGYAFALALMVVSAILPYLYFKRRGWL